MYREKEALMVLGIVITISFFLVGCEGGITGRTISDLESGSVGIAVCSQNCGDYTESITLICAPNPATGSCFNITAPNVVFDCAGYLVQFGTTEAGIGIQTNSSNVTIRNCIIVQANNYSLSSGIQISSVQNITLFNNTIDTIGINSPGIVFLTTPGTITIDSNTINASGASDSKGIVFNNVNNSLVKNNTIIVNGTASYGIFLTLSNNNILLNNNVTSALDLVINDIANGGNNVLIYNNSFGEINWTKSNLTTQINLSIRNSIILANNTVGLINNINILNLNSSAQLKFFSLPYHVAPQLLKNGVRCDNVSSLCNMSYASSTGILMANVSSFSNYTTFGDTTLPAVNLVSPDSNTYTNSFTPTFTFNFTDDLSQNSSCTLYINNTGYGTNISVNNNTNTNITANPALANTLYDWYVNCTDNSSNLGQSAIRTITIDTIAPSVIFNNINNGGNNSWTSNQNLSMNISATDANMNYWNLTLYNSSGVSVASNQTTVNITTTIVIFNVSYDDVYTVNLTAVDKSSNRNSTIWTINLDTAPPNISLISPANNSWNNSDPLNFTFNYTDTTTTSATCTLYVNNIPKATNTTTAKNTATMISASGMDQGYLSWNITCMDNASLSGNLSGMIHFDSITPVHNINSINDKTSFGSVTNNRNLSINFTATDVNINYWNISIYNSTSGLVTSNQTAGVNFTNQTVILNVSFDGLYTVNLTVVDNASNLGDSALTITVDTVVPSVYLNSPANLSWNNSANITFNFSFVDATSVNSSCSVYLNGVSFGTNATVNNNTNTTIAVNAVVTNGTKTWQVNCTDLGTNVGASGTQTLYVDQSTPVINLISPTDGYFNNSATPQFTFNFSDAISPNASCTLYTNGSSYFINTTVQNNTNTIMANASLVDGVRIWQINCTNLASTSANSSVRTLTVDTINPAVNSISLASITSSSTSITVNATDTSGISSCIYNLSGSAGNGTLTLSSGLYVKSVSSLSASTFYNVSVTCTDNASNVNASNSSFTTIAATVNPGSSRNEGNEGVAAPAVSAPVTSQPSPTVVVSPPKAEVQAPVSQQISEIQQALESTVESTTIQAVSTESAAPTGASQQTGGGGGGASGGSGRRTLVDQSAFFNLLYIKKEEPLLKPVKEQIVTQFKINLANTGNKPIKLEPEIIQETRSSPFLITRKLYQNSFLNKLAHLSYYKNSPSDEIFQAKIVGNLDEITIPPGKSIEKNIEVKYGIAPPEQLKIVFKSFGKSVLEKDLNDLKSKWVMGVTAQPKEEKGELLLDVYMILDAAKVNKNLITGNSIVGTQADNTPVPNYYIEFTLSELKNSQEKVKFLDYYGPYPLSVDKAQVFSQRLKLDPEAYKGPHLVKVKVYLEQKKQSRYIMEDSYEVNLPNSISMEQPPVSEK